MSQSIFVVMSSNCEAYEDYHEHIDSVWSSRELAVSHIEHTLGMEQVSHFDPTKTFSRDRWSKDFPEYPRREEYDSEEEFLEDAFDKDGKLIPYWVTTRDAWIEEYQLDQASE